MRIGEVQKTVEIEVGGSSGARFANKLVELLGGSATKTYCAFVREIEGERAINGTDAEKRLLFVKYGYLLRGRVPTLKDVGSVHGLITKEVEYKRHAQKRFCIGHF